MIRFTCPGCDATYTVEDAKGGKTGKCPKCQARFTIPLPAGGAAPPPPPAVDPNAPVEIAPCPKCQARLSVTAADLGVDVECPYCKEVYKAVRAGAAGGSAGRKALVEEDEERPNRRRRDDDEAEDRPSRRRRDEEEEEERPRRRRRGDEEEAEEAEARPSRRRRDEDEEEEEERPRRRREEEEGEEEERPRKRKKKRRRVGGGEPHRGTLILILGILGWIGCGIFTAIPAWTMGKADLEKMDQGLMDEEGRSLTQVGMYLGMASCILTLVVLLGYCVLFIIGMAAA